MTNDEQRSTSELAKVATIIDSIVLSLERFNEKLSDDRKIRMFKMNCTELKKLTLALKGTRAGMKAVALIVAAITASEQQQKRDEDKRLNSLID